MGNGDHMGLGKRGISIMQDAIIFCLMVSISAMVIAPTLFGGKMAHLYEEKEDEERVNEVLYTFLSNNKNDFRYILFDLNMEGINGKVINKFLGKEPIHASYGELISACLLSQIRCEGKNYNFFIKGFEREIEKEIEEFFRENLKGYNFNFTAVWQPIIGLDFGGKISVGDKIPDKDVYSSHLMVMMPPSFITSIGLEIEKIKNEIDKEKIKEYLNGFIDDFIYNNLNGFFDELREKISDFIFNDDILDISLGEFIADEFYNLFNEKMEESFDYVCIKISEFVKNSVDKFIDENYDKIEEIIKRIDFCRAEVTLCIWR